jgi:hypothetical protein
MWSLLPVLFAVPAQAVQIEVRHLGLVATYEVAPGDTLTEAWKDVVFPAQRTAERRRDRRPCDVNLVLDVTETDDEHVVVKLDLQRTARGHELYRVRPTLVTAAQIPALFVHSEERAVEAVDGASGDTWVRWLEQPVTEVRILPDDR